MTTRTYQVRSRATLYGYYEASNPRDALRQWVSHMDSISQGEYFDETASQPRWCEFGVDPDWLSMVDKEGHLAARKAVVEVRYSEVEGRPAQTVLSITREEYEQQEGMD